MDLRPPRLALSAEVCLCPLVEKDSSLVVILNVGKSKREGGRSANNGSGGGVLRSVAGTHELVVGSRPWDDTSQVGTHGIEAIALKISVLLNNKVGGITLQALGKRVVASLVCFQVGLFSELISKGILGGGSASSASSTRGEEEEDVGNGKSTDSDGSRTHEDQVHDVSALLVNVKLSLGSGHAHRSDSGAALDIDGGWGEGGGGADEGGR